MWQLFTAELRRFRFWALSASAVHLLVLGFMTRLVDLAQQPRVVYRVIAALYCAVGLLFGLVQMGGYRKANTWLQLLHRPLACWQIAGALLAAGAVLLAMTAWLPITLISIWQETMTARVVDARHWLLALSGALLGVFGYLIGVHCMLANRRVAFAAVVFLIVLMLNTASGVAALAVQLLLLLWLAALALCAFKPDLHAPPRHWLSSMLLAVPLQLGSYYLLILLCFGYELIWVMGGTHPNNAVPPRGGAIDAMKSDAHDLMLAGLSASGGEQAALWREQIVLSEIFEMSPAAVPLPKRGDLTNPQPLEFDDEQRHVRWVFSHDRMRFEGYSLIDNRPSGTLHPDSNHRIFADPVVPIKSLPVLPAGDALLLGARALYQYRSDLVRIMQRIQLPPGEVFVAPPEMFGTSVTVLSDRAVYIFDGRALRENEALLQARLRIPMNGAVGNLSRVDMLELVDGYLLSFTFAFTAHNARVAPRQQLLHAHDDGRIETVALRELSADYPQWHRYELWWLSPLLHAAHEVAINLFALPEPLRRIEPPPVPRDMQLLAAVLNLVTMLFAVTSMRHRGLPGPTRITWALICGVVGAPALLSLWLLLPIREHVSAPASQAVAA